MKDLLIEYGAVCTHVDMDDPYPYATSVTLDWAKRRGFEVRYNAERLSVLWLTAANEHTPIEGLHGLLGTLHVMPGKLTTVLSAYTYPPGEHTREHYAAFRVENDLETELTKLFDAVAWPVRH